MTDNGGTMNVPPFPPQYRASSLLLHVTSLPSPYGIGDVGIVGVLVGGSSPRCRPKMVASSAAWSHRLRQLSVSTDVVVCGKRHAD